VPEVLDKPLKTPGETCVVFRKVVAAENLFAQFLDALSHRFSGSTAIIAGLYERFKTVDAWLCI